jgi:hypothetical protein
VTVPNTSLTVILYEYGACISYISPLVVGYTYAFQARAYRSLTLVVVRYQSTTRGRNKDKGESYAHNHKGAVGIRRLHRSLSAAQQPPVHFTFSMMDFLRCPSIDH